ncbi:MAG: PHB depolymerase family esterase [Bacteroidota bacterium]
MRFSVALAAVAVLAGCTTPVTPPEGGSAWGPLDAATGVGEFALEVDYDGRTRSLLVHLPPTPEPDALVLALHGRFGSGASMRDFSGFSEIADREGFVVVYPDGVARSWADGRGTTPADQRGVDDVGFLAEVVRRVRDRFPIPADRVFAAGMSNGGFMAQRLAVERADLVGGIGTVAGSVSDELDTTQGPSEPVAVAFVHGTEDTLVPYAGDPEENMLGIEDAARRWAGFNGCPAPRLTETIDAEPDGTQVLIYDAAPCDEQASVRLYRVEGGGHTWPGSLTDPLPPFLVGRTSQEIMASEVLWDFFDAR